MAFGSGRRSAAEISTELVGRREQARWSHATGAQQELRPPNTAEIYQSCLGAAVAGHLLGEKVHLAFEIGEEDVGARAFGQVEIERLPGGGVGCR
jgi:hypothetical protein